MQTKFLRTNTMKLPIPTLLALAVLFADTRQVSQAAAGLINIDFNSTSGFGASGTYSGPAVLGGTGDVWNAVTGSSPDAAARTNLSLVTSTGAPSGAALSFSGQTGFFDDGSTGILAGIFASTPYAALMDDYLYVNPASTVTVSFTGLVPGDTYRLILYSSANNPGREITFAVNGVTGTVQDFSSDTSFAIGLNYADFTTTANASGQLIFTVASGPYLDEGDLNGIQLQNTTVPEPSVLVMSSILLGAFGANWSYRRLKRTAVAA
jgi:hypothetical protein